MNSDIILFDLDGTLTDPKLGITKSVQYALSKFDIIEPDLDKLEMFIGPPLAVSFTDFYGFSEAEVSQGVTYFREYFVDKGMFDNAVYSGIPELLQMLLNQGRTLMIATSKPTVYAEQIVRHFGIDHYFAALYGSNLDGTMADKTSIIRSIIIDKELNKESTIMIGDRKHDIIGANSNEISSIAVEYGYGNHDELLDSKPTYMYRTVAELTHAFSIAR
ncbi:phosphoglycolate phosphatase [Paenibacillus sp. DS2015]|uniref:HAD hydrolase-like protein n=1 Tax=Paenibacillus sp. DS2015 TaxID=3373917 RepID=UPI003D224107